MWVLGTKLRLGGRLPSHLTSPILSLNDTKLTSVTWMLAVTGAGGGGRGRGRVGETSKFHASVVFQFFTKKASLIFITSPYAR